ncbi:Acyl-coenzyme A synthetase acsm3, mitochondrial [Saguinus oedipus]|uniref:medium-chain acyl-CoA ligase n=1 Tax=Saguinus oedipus TaxID=9490 RepID=A0ABQ9UKL6_SAGOE|nr:Acyl-coenzyme A synthetase acsm3, mitochondrial [Saguinus oedipus]
MTSYKFESLKHCVSAGEPITTDVTELWRNKTGLDIYEGYGQTETVLICGNFKGMKIKPGSMGKPSPAFDVKWFSRAVIFERKYDEAERKTIVDGNGNVLPPGQEGDIGIQVLPNRPFGLFTHYVDNPSKTASTLRGNFYITGDKGYMDEDGYFCYRIGPFEVESALNEHPSVAESAVVSSPDPIRGEHVPRVSLDELQVPTIFRQSVSLLTLNPSFEDDIDVNKNSELSVPCIQAPYLKS